MRYRRRPLISNPAESRSRSPRMIALQAVTCPSTEICRRRHNPPSCQNTAMSPTMKRVESQSQLSPMKALENYLRMHRRRAGLTQGDIAYLLGACSGSKVSRYERFARRPTLETALALEIILGVPVADLFAGVREELEPDIKRRARRLLRRLAKQQAHRRTLTAVGAILERSNEEITYEPIR